MVSNSLQVDPRSLKVNVVNPEKLKMGGWDEIEIVGELHKNGYEDFLKRYQANDAIEIFQLNKEIKVEYTK